MNDRVLKLEWTPGAGRLRGPEFAAFQRALTKFNAWRLKPGFPGAGWEDEIRETQQAMLCEGAFVEAVRGEVRPLAQDIPSSPDAFVAWFEALKETGPGQGDPLFPWLAEEATLAEMRWFLEQEVAGEAGFEDLLALTQLKMPVRAKLEMARNFWDEMGRGQAKGMHGPMLSKLAKHFGIDPQTDNIVPESLALGNLMIALAHNRRYAYQAIGALGVIEMTAPWRSAHVDNGLRRLGVPAAARHYFNLHAVLDVKHSAAWNAEVLRPIIEAEPRAAQAIGEGALLRLWHGARCFDCYRAHFGLARLESAA